MSVYEYRVIITRTAQRAEVGNPTTDLIRAMALHKSLTEAGYPVHVERREISDWEPLP